MRPSERLTYRFDLLPSCRRLNRSNPKYGARWFRWREWDECGWHPRDESWPSILYVGTLSSPSRLSMWCSDTMDVFLNSMDMVVRYKGVDCYKASSNSLTKEKDETIF